MLEKSILNDYFGKYCIIGNIEDLLLDYEDFSNTGPLIVNTHAAPTQILGIRPFEEYESAIDFIKELGKLIDNHYFSYSLFDQSRLSKVYEHFQNSIFLGLEFEIRALMIECPEACKRFKSYFDEGIDRMLIPWGFTQAPCYCYTFSKTKQVLEKKRPEKTFNDIFFEDISKAFSKYSKDLFNIYYNTATNSDTDLKLAYGLSLLHDTPEISSKLFDDTTEEAINFRKSLKMFLKDIRQIEISLENLEIGQKLFNDIFPNLEGNSIDTPLEFIDKVHDGTIMAKLMVNQDRVPKFLSKLYSLVITEGYE